MTDITDRLKTAWIRQLREDWKSANYNYFKDAMRLPNLELSSAEGVMGAWKGDHYRFLSISIDLIKNHPWEYVQEVLYHEMAHQYVEEVLGIREEAPHGKAFRKVCLENGIDPAATGRLQSWVEKLNKGSVAGSEHHKILNKVNKLLALAQSANTHEAQSAMTKAHQLLLKHNLSMLDLQAELKYIHKQIGTVGRRDPVKSSISSIIGKFFFVETIWVFGYDPHEDRAGRVLEIYGTPENVEMAEYVYDYLQNVSEQLWAEHKRKKHLKGNRHRRTFIYGLLEGFYKKLDGRVIENRSKNLVWKGDPRLKAFYRRRNPKLVRSSSRYSRSCKDVYRCGVAQGGGWLSIRGFMEKAKVTLSS